jgi:hypothetical protein
MDPYLEDPALWPDVHHRLISVSSEVLLAQLRPKYFVQIEERLYVADDRDPARDLIIPDLRIRDVESPPEHRPRQSSGGGAVVAEPGIELAVEFEIRESRIEILDLQLKRVVTVIEFLSPANKVTGSAGKKSYDAKREEVIASDANLVEIDLLRGGGRLVGLPHDYLAQVWRWAGERHRRWIWPMKLRERLKPIPIPVRRDDPDAVLDLQAVLELAYDRAGYDLRVDYSRPPRAGLFGDDQTWSDGLLRAYRQPS